MNARAALVDLEPAVGTIRDLRYAPDDVFDDLNTPELVTVARNLRAVAYSARVVADRLDRIGAARVAS